MRRSTRLQSGGFSLAESLVALLIVAGVTAMFYQLISANADAVRAAEDRRMAMLVAQSVMASARTGAAGSGSGASSGTSAGFAWRIARTAGSASNARATGPGLVQLSVIVSPAGDNRARPLVRLETLLVAGEGV